jgi:hypothetical protein
MKSQVQLFLHINDRKVFGVADTDPHNAEWAGG